MVYAPLNIFEMSSPILAQCRRTATQVESAADQLGAAWSGYAPLTELCVRFRRASDELADNRGLAEITIAFVGPKKSGKTTLLGLLIRADEKRQRLKAGRSSDQSTEKPTWVGSEPPASLDPAMEELIPCHESEMVDLGFRYSLVDVPGFNERNEPRSQAALRALDSAVVKVLVVDRREIESRETIAYLGNADGTTLIPVVNFARENETPADLETFHRWLVEELPRSTVLPLVVVGDYEIAPNRERILVEARRELVTRLGQAVAGRSAMLLAEPQLTEKLRHFKKRVSQLAAEHLPATATALDELRTGLETLPAQALEKMLGSDRLIAANVRGRFRALLLERTPIVFFPWRLALSIANIVHGATDRVPLVLLGSLPSLITTAFAAVRNVKRAHEFASDVEAGLRRRIGAMLKEGAGPQLRALDHALQRDLGLSRSESPHTAVTSTAQLAGLETLQARSSEIFHDILEKRGPSRAAAVLLGFLGFAVFWGVFGWPMSGLYHDFALAAANVVAPHETAVRMFPHDVFSMLATSLLLAVLPMGLLLLVSVAMLTRRSRVDACAAELRATHEAELDRLTRAGLLTVEVSEPRIDACLSILTLHSRP